MTAARLPRAARALLVAAATLAIVAFGLVPAAPAHAIGTARIEGPDRFATAVEIDRAMDAVGGPVFLVSGTRFPDALAAAPVAAAEGGHLLLTAPTALPAAVAERISELAPSQIVVVGGPTSVSDAVALAAGDAAVAGGGDPEVLRLAGANRVETSLLLLERLRESGPVDTVWVASGATFPDALVAASVAGRLGHAVVLDHHVPTAAGSRAWLERVTPLVAGTQVLIAGGTGSVSAADEAGLARAASVQRHAGANRYETARAIVEAWGPERAPELLLATGRSFPDALAGAVLSAVTGAPLLLTPDACHARFTPMLRAQADALGVEVVIGLGSERTVSDEALALGRCSAPLREQIGQVYDTFPLQRHTGTGPRIIDLGRSVPYAQVVARIQGDSFLGIDALGERRQHLDSIASGWRAWAGTALWADYGSGEAARFLSIRTSGAWTVEVRDLTSAPMLGRSAAGGSGGVFLYDGPPATLALRGSSTPLMARELYGAALWQEELARQGGAIDLRLHGGPSVVAVRASDPWTATLR